MSTQTLTDIDVSVLCDYVSRQHESCTISFQLDFSTCENSQRDLTSNDVYFLFWSMITILKNLSGLTLSEYTLYDRV